MYLLNLGDKLPTFDDVHNLPYLDMVINENMRRHPAATALLSRKSVKDLNYNGIVCSKNFRFPSTVFSTFPKE